MARLCRGSRGIPRQQLLREGWWCVTQIPSLYTPSGAIFRATSALGASALLGLCSSRCRRRGVGAHRLRLPHPPNTNIYTTATTCPFIPTALEHQYHVGHPAPPGPSPSRGGDGGRDGGCDGVTPGRRGSTGGVVISRS